MSEIKVKENESLDKAIQRFKRQCAGVLKEVRDRKRYKKPSIKKREKSEAARAKKNKSF